MSSRMVLIAAAGALAGLAVITLTGLQAHIGSHFFEGPVAYVVSGIAGAFCAVVLLYAIRKEFGA